MDKVLFIVEGEKTEKQFVKLIYEQLYGDNSKAKSGYSQVKSIVDSDNSFNYIEARSAPINFCL